MASSLEEKLARLSQEYLNNLTGRMTRLDAHWQCLVQDSRQDALSEALIVVHSIAGSASTFGFAEVSTKARALELMLRELETGGQGFPLPAQKLQELEAMKSSLEQSIKAVQYKGKEA